MSQDTESETEVYYDASVGEVYRFTVGEDSITLHDPVTDEKVETLERGEYDDLHQDLFRVPEQAIRDPIGYMHDHIAAHMESAELDAGYLYADYVTTVNRKGENEELLNEIEEKIETLNHASAIAADQIHPQMEPETEQAIHHDVERNDDMVEILERARDALEGDQ